MNMSKIELKFFSKIVGVALLGLLPLSCKDTETYADYVESVKEEIATFITSNNIAVTEKMPEGTGQWKDGDRELYYNYTSGKADGLYYHQVELGDGDLVLQNNWTAYVRYVGYTLNGKEIYNCTARYSPDPQGFVLLNSPYGTRFGVGFQQAVKNLRVGGHCKVIIPFDIGNSYNIAINGGNRSDIDNKQPMLYEIWLVGLE
jgi:hypothetical protein